ncbi:hypothetical protein TPHA_0C03210 [Tetrapisispora phaffii CBS 4417]|uniref:Conserved oligomeric Golgi complex subunit 5 n=1 Tax=Tetrapisispora phaffii (strain ATCC 24235 / CBS 4417 / NBRC 1672 / NRRL Y-8282 / UCD 70-5) TaxID=1071381 RepID=G8BRU8_TETPH|nr:hypothetical protein TPHA_0C03210 [Tetrapisispora phaffii CBS 4417]CCE62474.1 hypothetical protein TPHA_0C03210 [Tetrapisispora phaffii CBS 4417]
MSSSTEYNDIDEQLLHENFSVVEFSNDLLTTVSSNDSLFFQLPLKKMNYELEEIEKRIEKLIKTYSMDLVNQFYKKKNVNSVMQKELHSILHYLNISYNRLNDDIILKYDKIKKLQNILNKIHQTSNLLRDSMIFLHLVNKMMKIKLNMNNILELSILQSQLNYILSNNLNLITLKLIKKLKNDILVKNEKELVSFTSINIIKMFNADSTTEVDYSRNSELAILIHSLGLISKNDFVSNINKILNVIILSTSQSLSKSINSIKILPSLFDNTILPNATKIYQLENLLKSIQLENENGTFFTEFINLQRSKPLQSSSSIALRKANKSLLDIYWSSVSSLYKKDFEITINRGGPVGKSLITNKSFIIDTFKDKLSTEITIDKSESVNFSNYIEVMSNSIVILSKKN